MRLILTLILVLAFASVSVAQTPDPKPLERRVELLEARIAKLERLLAIQPATVSAAPVEVVPANFTTYSRATQETCVGGNCGQSQGVRSSGPIRRLFGLNR